MRQTNNRQTGVDALEQPLFKFGTRTYVAWTVFSALGVWLALSVAEGLAIERCLNDSLAWNWTTWSCTHPSGTIILPQGLRRAGSD
jgi:hypothetical protein